jgi:hypothetical protein
MTKFIASDAGCCFMETVEITADHDFGEAHLLGAG